MAKTLLVPQKVYREIEKTSSGGEVLAFVHAHCKLSGPCEVISGGRKPIKCSVSLAESKAERRGATDRTTAVQIRRH